jgi:hypothetical protein
LEISVVQYLKMAAARLMLKENRRITALYNHVYAE